MHICPNEINALLSSLPTISLIWDQILMWWATHSACKTRRTCSGRMEHSKPAIQNIPVRVSKEVRL